MKNIGIRLGTFVINAGAFALEVATSSAVYSLIKRTKMPKVAKDLVGSSLAALASAAIAFPVSEFTRKINADAKSINIDGVDIKIPEGVGVTVDAVSASHCAGGCKHTSGEQKPVMTVSKNDTKICAYDGAVASLLIDAIYRIPDDDEIDEVEDDDMQPEYDFSEAKKNPYAGKKDE